MFYWRATELWWGYSRIPAWSGRSSAVLRLLLQVLCEGCSGSYKSGLKYFTSWIAVVSGRVIAGYGWYVYELVKVWQELSLQFLMMLMLGFGGVSTRTSRGVSSGIVVACRRGGWVFGRVRGVSLSGVLVVISGAVIEPARVTASVSVVGLMSGVIMVEMIAELCMQLLISLVVVS